MVVLVPVPLGRGGLRRLRRYEHRDHFLDENVLIGDGAYGRHAGRDRV